MDVLAYPEVFTGSSHSGNKSSTRMTKYISSAHSKMAHADLRLCMGVVTVRGAVHLRPRGGGLNIALLLGPCYAVQGVSRGIFTLVMYR